MSLLVSVQQACCDALAAWLASDLEYESISIEPRWPEPDRQLPPRHISIITAGPRKIDWLPIEMVTSVREDLGASPSLMGTWRLGEMTQPVQLDLWATSDVERDHIMTLLDASLNKGAVGLGVTANGPFSAGLQLQLLGDWEPVVADYLFETVTPHQSPMTVAEYEWRTTFSGTATAMLVQRARSPRLARVLLEQRLDCDLSVDLTTITIDTL